MQLMTLNSLLMFDIVFIFFLFLVGVTCLVYYLPPPALNSKSGSSSIASSSSGTTTTCTGETVRFRRYSVGSLLSANDVAVGNLQRFHSSPTAAREDELTTATTVVECGVLEEILSLSGASSSHPVAIPACACYLEQHRHHQHLIENPHDPTPPVGSSGGGAVAGVDYVQIEIERGATDPAPPCCYVRAKDADVKKCHGPIHDV